jgi:hypothetical protein
MGKWFKEWNEGIPDDNKTLKMIQGQTIERI